MAKSDGSIRVTTELDNSEIPKDLKELKDMVAKGGAEVTEEFAYKVKDLENKWNGLKQKQAEATETVMKYKKQFSDVTQEAAKLHEQINRINQDKVVAMSEQGALKGNNKDGSNTQAINEYDNIIGQMNAQIASLKEQLGGLGDNVQLKTKLDGANQRLNDIGLKMEKVNIDASKLNGNTSKTVQAFTKVKAVLGGVGNVLKKTITATGRFAKNMASVAFNAIKTRSSMNGGLKSLMRYAGALIGIRAMYSGLRNLASEWLNGTTAAAQKTQAILTAAKSGLANALGPVIQWIVNLLATAVQYVGGLIKALTGMDIFAGTAKSAENSLGNAAKSAKEIKKQLAGFDEMNVLQKDSDSSGGGGDAGTVTADVELTGLGDWSKIIDMFKKAWKDGDFTEIGMMLGSKLNDAMNSINWGPIQETSRKIASSIATFLNGFIAGTDWTLVGRTFGEGVNTIIEFAYTAVTTFDWGSLGKALGDAVNSFISTANFSKAVQSLSIGIKGILKSITTFIKTLDWGQLGRKIYENIMSFDWLGIAADIAVAIGLGILGLGQALVSFIGEACADIGNYFTEYITEAGGNIPLGLLNGILAGLSAIDKWLYDNLVMPIVNGVKEMFGIHSPSTVFMEIGQFLIEGLLNGISSLFGSVINLLVEMYEGITGVFVGIGTWFTEKFESAVTGIKSAFSSVGNWFGQRYNDITNVFDRVGSWFSDKFNEAWKNITNIFSLSGVRSFFDGVLNGIKNVFSSIPNWFRTKFNEAWTAVKNVFSSGGAVFSGIKDGILSGLKSVINTLIGGINTVIAIPFNGINSALNKLRGISILGHEPFSWLPTIAVPQIPKLATGTYATSPMYAQIGEAGKEAVVPLENNTQWANDFLEVLEKHGGGFGGKTARVIQLVLNGKVIKEIYDDEEKDEMFRRNGELRYG